MKKKILLILFASFMIMGVVSAASLWGSHKGNQIIKLAVNGAPVKVSDAPAISMDGRTMIPIYLLKQAGINYTWDQKKQTVNINKKDIISETNSLIISKQYEDFYQTLSACLNKSETYAVGLLNANPVSDEGIVWCDESLTTMMEINDQSLKDSAITKTDIAGLRKLSVSGNALLKKYKEQNKKLLLPDVAGAEKLYNELIATLNLEIVGVNDYVYNLMLNLQKNETVIAQVPVEPKVETPDPEPYTPPVIIDSGVVTSKIDGTFEGFENGQIFKLANGQIWEQTSYDYKYSYKYRPDVTIYKDGFTWYMLVDGVDGKVKVKRID